MWVEMMLTHSWFDYVKNNPKGVIRRHFNQQSSANHWVIPEEDHE